MRLRGWCLTAVFLHGLAACGGGEGTGTVITVSTSALGAEARLLRRQLHRFMADNPTVRVVERPTPDAADQRHQLYVQWLNARSSEPDLLQLDVIWTPEFAAAGWIRTLDDFAPDVTGFFPRALEANRWRGRLYALPWFIDVGMLYYRTDLVPRAPATFAELARMADEARRRDDAIDGFVWQGARYEGLVTTYLEHLGGFGGHILDADGHVRVDGDAAVRALTFMRDAVRGGTVPAAALTWREEQSRFAFQNGRAVFMRNWPYCYPLLQDPRQSRVAGRVGIAPMPAAPGGQPTAALGGSQLAINAHSRHPRAAYALLAYLTAPEQMRERAHAVGQYPARPALYDDALQPALGVSPATVRDIIDRATPRPVTPVYTELSAALQAQLHRALTGQAEPRPALASAAATMRRVLAGAERGRGAATPGPRARRWLLPALAAAAALLAALAVRRWRRRGRGARATVRARRERRLAWGLVAPALGCLAAVVVVPLSWTLWESLHRHDLRFPWQGRPFVGLENYLAVAGDRRCWAALGHTAIFTLGSVTLELGLGLVLALALHRAYRGRGLVRAMVLVPWALPTVVAALVWRFLFDDRAGLVNAALASVGLVRAPVVWFVGAVTAWVPVILADVWKTTPFVTLLLLAGRQGIAESLYEAARIDGASAWRQFRYVTLPLLRPVIVIALLFRTLDAVRVFDLIYVLTGGGPGTATEPLGLYTFTTLLQHLRFGYGAALAVVGFLATFALAALYVRALGAQLTEVDE